MSVLICGSCCLESVKAKYQRAAVLQTTGPDPQQLIETANSMATGPTSFHSFSKLPQELRDEIWRECLPRMVIDIDWPDDCFTLGLPSKHDMDSEDGRPRSRPVPKVFDGCRMRQSTGANAKPPVISRVCRESRRVAFDTGALLEHKLTPRGQGGDDLDGRVRQQWVDRARDVVVHLHYNAQKDRSLGVTTARGNPIRILRDTVSMGAIGSISECFLFSNDRVEGRRSRDLLEGMKKVMVCLKVVCFHVDAEPAIESGLFGRLGEELVVMVDALDDQRVDQFRDLWEKHGSSPDSLTGDFFKRYSPYRTHNGRPAVQDRLEKIRARWLRDRWHDITGWWVTELLWSGRTRQSWHESKVPGLVKEEVWDSAPPRPRLRRDEWQAAGIPNRGHSWVRETYSRMPKFLPTIMFRLCTNKYYLH